MAFDISGVFKDVSRMDTGREQIRYIPYNCIIPDENNGYSMPGIPELARNIEIIGLEQPLRVWPMEDPSDCFRIISGHRRHAAIGLLIEQGSDLFAEGVPCIVESSKASAALQKLMLLFGNADNRKFTAADEIRQAELVSDCIRQLEKEGYQFPGRHRDWVAKISGMSKTKVARIEAIKNNLQPQLIDRFNAGSLGITAAYRISQEKPEIQQELLRRSGPVLGNLTDAQLEEAISLCKTPKQPEPEKSSSQKAESFEKVDAFVGSYLDSYLEKRKKESDDYFQMLNERADEFLDTVNAVNSRSEGIEALKKEYGRSHYGSCGPKMVCFESTPKGLTLYHSSTHKEQIFRTWTEVYDMLCTIALNRAVNGRNEAANDVEDEEEDVTDDESPEEEEEPLPTVRWTSRAVTPPEREPLLLYALTNDGPRYTPAVYWGGATFCKPTWDGKRGKELPGMAQQFTEWMQYPDPVKYGIEFQVAPTKPSSLWRDGEPEKEGWYAVKIQIGSFDTVYRRVLYWDEGTWLKHEADDAPALDDLDRVVCWYPLPEEDE